MAWACSARPGLGSITALLGLFAPPGYVRPQGRYGSEQLGHPVRPNVWVSVRRGDIGVDKHPDIALIIGLLPPLAEADKPRGRVFRNTAR
jgi:hypothetical protein